MLIHQRRLHTSHISGRTWLGEEHSLPRCHLDVPIVNAFPLLNNCLLSAGAFHTLTLTALVCFHVLFPRQVSDEERLAVGISHLKTSHGQTFHVLVLSSLLSLTARLKIEGKILLISGITWFAA